MIDKDLKTIADYFKIDNQSTKLIEEIGELLQAIAKSENNNNGEYVNALHVIEEIVDTKIVLDQIEYLMNKPNIFTEMRKQKIQRTLERIESGYYTK